METLLIVLAIITWFAIGCSAVVWDIRKRDNVFMSDILFIFIGGIAGVMTLIIIILYNSISGVDDKVLFKKKEN